MAVALLQEVRTAIGFHKQTDLVTPLVAADMVSMRQTNTDFIQSTPVNEDDAADLGKGPYTTATFPSHLTSGGSWNGRITSQALALIFSFAFGKNVQTDSANMEGFIYTIHEPDFLTAGLDMPVTTMAVQIRTSMAAITDKAVLALACEEVGISFRTGPGRDNATFTSSWIGTGKYVKPSAIVIPDPYDETGMNAGTITVLTILGFNYISNKRFVNFDFKMKNNIRDGSSKFPGSGSQGNYQISGRLRRGIPAFTLTAQVECDAGSNEEDALLAQTEGTGVITMVGPLIGAMDHHAMTITFHRLIMKATPIGEADGIAAYNLEYFVMQDADDGVITIAITTDLDEVLGAA